MKPVIIYHDSCADGFGAAFAAWLKFGKEAIYIPCQHGNGKPATVAEMNSLLAKHDVPNADKDVQLFILDFSFDKPVMDWLFDVMGHIVWLDHHKSAKRRLQTLHLHQEPVTRDHAPGALRCESGHMHAGAQFGANLAQGRHIAGQRQRGGNKLHLAVRYPVPQPQRAQDGRPLAGAGPVAAAADHRHAHP